MSATTASAAHGQIDQPSETRRLAPPTPRLALVIVAAIVIGVVLYLARHALTPFIVGALLIYLLDPAVSRVARIRVADRSVPRGLAVLLVYIVTVIVIYQVLRLLLGPLVSQILQYVQDLPALLASLESALAQLSAAYQALDLPEAVRGFIDDALADLGEGAGSIDFGSLLPIATTLLGTAAGFFAFLIIPIWAFYILRDRVALQQNFLSSLPAAWRDEVWSVITIIERVFGRWIRGQIILGLIVGAATFAGLLVLGWLVDPRFLQFAVLLAVIAGLFELLPIIGPIISMIPTLLLALTTRDPVTAIVGVLILYIAVQQLENAVLVPKIQGDAVELHPSLVIFVLIIGGAIGGLLGAILAIPITAAARDVYRYLFRKAGNDDDGDTNAQPVDRGPPAAADLVAAPAADREKASKQDPAPATTRRKRRTATTGGASGAT